MEEKLKAVDFLEDEKFGEGEFRKASCIPRKKLEEKLAEIKPRVSRAEPLDGHMPRPLTAAAVG